MTRVEEERAQQRYEEQKRLEKQSQTKNAASAEQFKKVVAAKQETQVKVARRQEPTGNMSKQQQSSQKKGQAQARLMTKSGIASRDLQAELMKRSDKVIEQHQADHKERDIDLHQKQDVDHEHQTAQAQDDAKHVQAQSDKLAAIAGDEKRKGSENEMSQGGEMAGGQMGMMGQAPAQTISASDVKGAAGAARLPESAVRALIKACRTGINPKGLAQFEVDLRDDVLGGAKMKITANGNEINVVFTSHNREVRKLVKDAAGDRDGETLKDAFKEGGLILKSFTVSAF